MMNEPAPVVCVLQDEFDKLILHYRDNPLAFIHVMGAVPTNQQILLLHDSLSFDSARVAVKSCTSSGKTASLAWMTLWGLLTQDDIRILATAPTWPLLNRVFRTEVDKWHTKLPPLLRDAYIMNQDRIIRKGEGGKPTTHRCDFATASSDNEQALAGGHSGNYWIIVDEGSAVEDVVFQTLVGTLSYGEHGRMIIATNPTRSVGFVYDLFSQQNPYWSLHTFTAYDSPHITKEYIDEVRYTYGEDHDFFRVRICGEIPKAASTQYITSFEIDNAQKLNLSLPDYHHYPKVGGIDVARFGDDDTVFITRQGPKITDITHHHGLNTMEVAGLMVQYWQQHNHQMIFVDGTGLGAGVVDRGRELGVPLVDVVVANKSSNPQKYVNVRSQLYGSMKEWLANGADVPNDPELRKQMLSMEYGYNGRMQIQLMSKKELKKKNGFSPDIPDAIALTFADDVYLTVRRGASGRGAREVVMGNYLWA
jgi:hypothetical protein